MAKAENPRAVPGDNSKDEAAVAGDRVRAFVERLERLAEDKAAIADDMKEVFAEAKGQGFDTKVLREILRIRKQDPAERQEHYALVRLYADAIGLTAFD